MWTVLICDDDVAFLHSLEKTIQSVIGEKIEKILLFEGKEQLSFYLEDDPAKMVLKYQPDAQIIFVSGYDSYFLDVYDVDHVYFLRKPIEEDQLIKAFRRAEAKIEDLKLNSFIISNKQGIQRVPFDDILFFEKERRRLHVHTVRGTFTRYESFDELEKKLDDRFVRCHNSYVVNIGKAMELSDRKFRFDSEKPVPVSKTYYTKVKDAFLTYLSKGSRV